MLLPQRQITRHKLCFYYACKFGVISIKYVINLNNTGNFSIILFCNAKVTTFKFKFKKQMIGIILLKAVQNHTVQDCECN
jgi:hypothetical protein